MAQIPLPVFSLIPTAAELNAALAAILHEIGGVDAAGLVAPGNLDATNLRVAPGFRNGQKAEPYSQFSATVSDLDAPGEVGPFPFDAVLFAVAFDCSATWTVDVTVSLAGRALAPLHGQRGMVSGVFQWSLATLVPAGTVVKVAVVTDAPADTPWSTCLLLKAMHRR